MRALSLLKKANDLLTHDLLTGAKSVRGFGDGAAWMHLVLSKLGAKNINEHTYSRDDFERAGTIKYAIALLGAVAVWVLSWMSFGSVLCSTALFVISFYALEVQAVFLFPCMITGHERVWRSARLVMLKSGGTIAAICTVLPLAAVMLLGGFFGQGFVRSWALGCAAVAIWYVETVSCSNTDTQSGLDIWRYRRLLVRHEGIKSDKLKTGQNFKFLLLSDLHFGSVSSSLLRPLLLEQLSLLKPDFLLIAGDLVENVAGIGELDEFLSALQPNYPLLACAGNHDLRAGVDAVTAIVKRHGGHWLAEDAEQVVINGVPLEIAAKAASLTDRDAVKIICAHYPTKSDVAGDRADLIVSGHLHGSQIVLWRWGKLLFPGRLFFKWNGERFKLRNSELIMSNGLGDTIPIRFNCAPEIVCVTVSSTHSPSDA